MEELRGCSNLETTTSQSVGISKFRVFSEINFMKQKKFMQLSFLLKEGR